MAISCPECFTGGNDSTKDISLITYSAVKRRPVEQVAMNLQQELNRPVPFRSQDQEVLLNFLRIGDQLDNRMSRLFREHGLTLSRFNILRSLALASRPLTCGEIGQQMIQVVPAVTSLVDHLCSQELAERKRCTEDRRVVHVSITEKGRKLVEQTMEPLYELEDRMLKQLNDAEKEQLLQLLNRTRESIAQCDDACQS